MVEMKSFATFALVGLARYMSWGLMGEGEDCFVEALGGGCCGDGEDDWG